MANFDSKYGYLISAVPRLLFMFMINDVSHVFLKRKTCFCSIVGEMSSFLNSSEDIYIPGVTPKF